MKMNTLRLKRTTLAVLCTLLLSAAGMTKGWAQKSLPYYYGWETSHGAWASAGWTTVSPTGSISYAASNAIHIGSYGCQFSQPATTSAEQKYLITPELDGTEGVLASFWYRNFSANYGSGAFNWGYVTSPDFDPANFDVTLVNWVNENAITPSDFAWHQTENFACPVGTRYVVISCYLTQTTTLASYAFIDDVSLIKPVSKSISEGYSYGFENNDLATEGWTTQNGYVNSNKVLQTTIAGNNAPRNGSYGFQFNYASTASPQYLISPKLTGTESGVQVSFYYGVFSGSQTFYVGYSTTTSETTAFTFGNPVTATNATSANNKNFMEYSVVLPANTKYVAVKYTSSGYTFLDDFTFSEPAQCDAPTIDESNITATANTITFGWTGGSGLYNVDYKMNHENTWTSFATPSTTSTSANLTGLTSGMTYNLRVQSVCGSETSVWANATINTLCETKTYGYTFGFEDSEGGLNCWTTENTDGSTGIATSYAIYPIPGSSKGFQFTGSVEGGQYLITPELTTNANDGVLVSFYQTAYSSAQTFQVGYSTTSNAIADFTFGEEISTTTSNNDGNTTEKWALCEQAFRPDDAVKYVAIKFTGDYYFFVDQFALAVAPACDAPTNVVATPGPDNVKLTWEGEADAYKVEYKVHGAEEWTEAASIDETTYTISGLAANTDYQAQVTSVCGTETSIAAQVTFTTLCGSYDLPYTYDFEDAKPYACWSTSEGASTSSTRVTSNYAHGGNYVFQFFNNANDEFGEQTLIAPELNGDGTKQIALSFWYRNFASYYQTSLKVGYKASNTEDFTWEAVAVSGNAWTECFKILPANTKFVAVSCHVFNPGTGESPTPGSAWFLLDDFSFTQPKTFITEGAWNDASKWSDGVVPTASDDVVIYAPATINSGTVAYANQITYGANGSITIKDGGQLQHKSSGLVATMEKTIIPYAGDKDNYYLLASPILNSTGISPTSVTNMLSNNYDLYQYDGIQENEWTNYKVGDGYNLFNGKGYLYANSGNGYGNVTLSFTGTLRPFVNAYANNGYYLTYDNSSDQGNLKGFNLVGNTFAANAYIVVANYNNGQPTATTGTYYYKLNATIGEVIPSTGAVAPLEGVFVQANAANQVAICYTTPQTYGESALTMNLNQAGILTDAAVVRFNEGNNLSKFQLNPNSTKLYIPQGGKDYAVVRSEAEGELPVNFRAAENGTYTLSFSMEDVEFNSLHLIDNMTGVEVDLLATPSYTFNAKKTDYASRFRLVFSTTGVEENGTEANANFAYFNGSEWVVNATENATLEVVDMMGRTVAHGTRSVGTNGLAQGVYVLRLIDGNSVKTQKIVVR